MAQLDRARSAFVQLRGGAAPRAQIVFFPHAGGAATQFAELAAHLPAWLAVLAVEYAGHGRRSSESCAATLPGMAQEVADAWEPGAECVVFFGHSMGGLVAYECAKRLEGGEGAPRLVLASATRAPHLPVRSRLGACTDTELAARLQRLGGTDAELLADPDFLQFGLAAYRADCAACDAYQDTAAAALSASVLAYGGLGDPFVDRSELDAWRAIGGKRVRMFPGDHFYLRAQAPLVAEMIVRDVLDVLTPA